MSSLNFSEYTAFRHSPNKEHYKYEINHDLWMKKNVTSAIDTLVPKEQINDTEHIAGPYQEIDHTMHYTCVEQNCDIPCVCILCVHGPTSECTEHEVNIISSGFDAKNNLFTVRNADSYNLGHIVLDKYDSNKYCLSKSCRNGVKYASGKSKGEPVKIVDRYLGEENILKCTETDCECPQCPYCKTVQLIKFTDIPNNCQDCQLDLDDHEAHHIVVHDYCKFCDYITKEANDFECKDEFDFWTENEIIRNQDLLTCHLCEREFKSVQTRIRHLKEIHGEEYFECECCDFLSIYKQNMKQHNQNKHQEKKKIDCDLCEFTSYYRKNMNRHKINAHERHDEKWKFECDMCEFTSNYEDNIKAHKINVHKNLNCEECDFETTKKIELNKHIRNSHTKKPKLECDQCDFNTTDRKRLTQHKKRSHN